MTAESLGHVFIFIGIMPTWLFPLWLYFHYLDDDDEITLDYINAVVYSGIYLTFIAHYFEFTVSVSVW